jgi:hypothetical protein
MRAGELDKRLKVYGVGLADDGLSKVEAEPVLFLDAACKATAVSDREKLTGGTLQAALTYRFVIRSSPLADMVDATYQVEFKGKRYGIFGAKPVEDGDDRLVEITAGAQLVRP